ncbi:MAG: hypothetical protein U0103_26080 [Candidatus Obscuribacterales bacterium]
MKTIVCRTEYGAAPVYKKKLPVSFQGKKVPNCIALTGGGTKLDCKNPKFLAIMFSRKGGTPWAIQKL